MSAVSAESPRGSADLNTSVSSPKAADEQAGNGAPAGQADFGPNQWLVDELYQRYQADPGSVDQAWWSFFADYHPPAGAAASPAAPQPAVSQPAVSQPAASQPAASQPAAPQPAASRPAPSQPAAGRAPTPPTHAPGQSAPTAPGTTATTTDRASADRASATGPDGQGASTAAAQAQGPAGTGTSVEAKPGGGGTAAPDVAQVTQATQAAEGAERTVRLRGAAARTAANMTASLTVPTATSVRHVAAKLLVDNRIVINNHLARGRGGKISFTHMIGYALVRALAVVPDMNFAFGEADGKPVLLQPEHVNLGLAIDVQKGDGSRQLLVPSIKNAETMDFQQFWMAYEDIIRKARTGKLTVDDFAGTTISLTNPGTIGTEHSVPRLMAGQGCIVGVGAMEWPAAYQGAAEETLARLAISKTVTLTSTYDHRIIQGAQSGDFLRIVHQLLLGADGFYDDVFASLRIPYEPVRWVQDIPAGHEDDITKAARVYELIHAYRVRGHLMADTDPLEYRQRKHPDLDINQHGLTLWDLEREFATGGFGGKPRMQLREILGVLRDSYCRTVGIEYMHIQNPEERAWIQARVERPHPRADHDEQLRILSRLNVAEAFEMFLQTKFVGQRRFSLEGAESLIPLLDAVLTAAADDRLHEAVIGMAHRGRLNVLANIVGKSYGQIFAEFEG